MRRSSGSEVVRGTKRPHTALHNISTISDKIKNRNIILIY